MRITLSDIPIYCLTCQEEGGPRREHVKSIIQPEFVTPVIGISTYKSGATGFFRMAERGLKAQVRGEPFKPFLMLEDDISFSIDKSSMTVDVPDDADLLYVGLSRSSMNDYTVHDANYFDVIDGFPDVVRIKHMLATHGIIVCSALGASIIQRSMLEVYFMDIPWDLPLAYIQPYYNVYALRRPWVYQDSNYGGNERFTRVTLDGDGRKLPKEWLSRNYETIRMM